MLIVIIYISTGVLRIWIRIKSWAGSVSNDADPDSTKPLKRENKSQLRTEISFFKDICMIICRKFQFIDLNTVHDLMHEIWAFIVRLFRHSWNFIRFACLWIRIDLAWIRRIRIKVRPVTGSVTHFVQILDPDPYKMIRIRNTDCTRV